MLTIATMNADGAVLATAVRRMTMPVMVIVAVLVTTMAATGREGVRIVAVTIMPSCLTYG